MSRSGYSYDLDVLDLGRWRGQVASATRGKRGQAFFRELIEALDAMPEKRLIHGDLKDDAGCVCALGAVALKRGADPDKLDTYDYDALGQMFNIAHQLAQEVMYWNDLRDNPEDRWTRMRAWAEKQIESPSPGRE